MKNLHQKALKRGILSLQLFNLVQTVNNLLWIWKKQLFYVRLILHRNLNGLLRFDVLAQLLNQQQTRVVHENSISLRLGIIKFANGGLDSWVAIFALLRVYPEKGPILFDGSSLGTLNWLKEKLGGRLGSQPFEWSVTAVYIIKVHSCGPYFFNKICDALVDVVILLIFE